MTATYRPRPAWMPAPRPVVGMPCNAHNVEPDYRGAAWYCLDCDAPATFDETYVSDLNGAEVTFDCGEFVCGDCLTNVMPEGHDRDACKDAAYETWADRAADAYTDYMMGR